jgi:hypothetical protein
MFLLASLLQHERHPEFKQQIAFTMGILIRHAK